MLMLIQAGSININGNFSIGENVDKMKRRKKLTILILITLGLGALSAATLYHTVDAASSGVVSAHGAGFGRDSGSYPSQELADALGITLVELQTAYFTANENAIHQAVEDGLITQSQADQLIEGGTTFPFHRGRGWFSGKSIDFDALLADALGIPVDRLQEAYQQANLARVDQAVADGRISEDEADFLRGSAALYSNENFRSSIQSAFEAAVQQAVEAGVITQSQADQILIRRSSGAVFLNFHEGMHGLGRHGGRGKGLQEGPASFSPTSSGSNDL
jgi:hypothetical protein